MDRDGPWPASRRRSGCLMIIETIIITSESERRRARSTTMRSGAVNEAAVRGSVGRRTRLARVALLAVAAAVTATSVAACSSASADGGSASGKIVAIGAENEYADVIGQVGGKYVQSTAIMSNP